MRAVDAVPIEKSVITSGDEDEDDDYDEDESNEVTFYRVFGDDKEPKPWVMEIEDEIPTLGQILTHTPKELGFNIELKYDEENSCDTRRLVAELRAILAVCMSQPGRRIVFSSFDPDAVLLMRAIQGSYPVMILTDGEPDHADPRRRSVAAAMEVAPRAVCAASCPTSRPSWTNHQTPWTFGIVDCCSPPTAKATMTTRSHRRKLNSACSESSRTPCPAVAKRFNRPPAATG